jgi:hypothetical protein
MRTFTGPGHGYRLGNGSALTLCADTVKQGPAEQAGRLPHPSVPVEAIVQRVRPTYTPNVEPSRGG